MNDRPPSSSVLAWTSDKTTTAVCPACCSSSKKTSLVEAPGNTFDEYCIFFKCGECWSIFPHPLPRGTFYTGDKPYLTTKHYVQLGAGISALTELVVSAAASGNIETFLDVGCGYGFTVDFARRIFGWDSFGIDPSPYARHGARALGVPIFHELLGHGSCIDHRKFDFVLSAEVIEHVATPTEFVETLRSAVDAQGIVILTTPNALFVRRGNWEEGVIAALSAGEHAVLFSPQALENIIRRAGFEQVKIIIDNQHIVAAASPARDVSDFRLVRDTSAYKAYLTELVASSVEDEVRLGMALRLFKEQVNEGNLTEAKQTWAALSTLVRATYGAHFFEGDSLEALLVRSTSLATYGASAPMGTSIILFYYGLLLISLPGDAGAAETMLRYAVAFAEREIAMAEALFVEAASLLWSMHYHHALALLMAGERDRALVGFGKIIAFADNPQSTGARAPLQPYIVTRALYQSGIAHLQKGESDRALEDFRRLLERDEEPENQGLYPEAMRHLQLAVEQCEKASGSRSAAADRPW